MRPRTEFQCWAFVFLTGAVAGEGFAVGLLFIHAPRLELERQPHAEIAKAEGIAEQLKADAPAKAAADGGVVR